MADPRTKSFIITLEIEDFTLQGVLKRLDKLLSDERTISFEIKEKED